MANETKKFYPGAYNKSDYSYNSIRGAENPVGKGSNNTGSYATINLKTGSRATTYTRWPFDCSSIPVGATIDSVACNVAALSSRTSTNYVPTRTLQLYSGTTAKGSATTISSTKRSVYTLSCGAWTRDELQSCNLYIYAKRGTAGTSMAIDIWFYGADLTITYTYQSEKFMLKLSGAWQDIARVFKKVNGIWVEQTDLANVIDDGVRYQNGGEYVSPYKTVTITGSGEDSKGYFHSSVSIGGIQYKNATTLQVEPGTVVTIKTYQHAIYLNGVLVAAQTMFPTYEHTVTSNCSITLVNNGNESVTITTE